MPAPHVSWSVGQNINNYWMDCYQLLHQHEYSQILGRDNPFLPMQHKHQHADVIIVSMVACQAVLINYSYIGLRKVKHCNSYSYFIAVCTTVTAAV